MKETCDEKRPKRGCDLGSTAVIQILTVMAASDRGRATEAGSDCRVSDWGRREATCLTSIFPLCLIAEG